MRSEYTITCDDKRCTRQIGGSASTDERAQLVVFERAREAGWDVDGSGHWCHEHREVRA